MSWTRSLFHDVFTAHGLSRRDREEAARRRMRRRCQRRIADRDRKQDERIEELDEDLRQVAVVARSLADTVVEKGLATRQELEERLLALGERDGETDGGLDPEQVRPGGE